MSPITYKLAAMVALVHVALANFDLNVIRGEIDTVFPWPDTFGAWVLTDSNDPKCSDLAGNPIATWAEKNDLSHGRLGIRCVPGNHCGYYHPDDDPWPSVELVEMHFTNEPLYHWTIYKDRGYKGPDGFTWLWPMYGTDGDTYGACHEDTRLTWDCAFNNNHLRLKGRRKFRCLTAFTAAQINAAWKKNPPSNVFAGYQNPEVPYFYVISHNGTDISSNNTSVAWTE